LKSENTSLQKENELLKIGLSNKSNENSKSPGGGLGLKERDLLNSLDVSLSLVQTAVQQSFHSLENSRAYVKEILSKKED